TALPSLKRRWSTLGTVSSGTPARVAATPTIVRPTRSRHSITFLLPSRAVGADPDLHGSGLPVRPGIVWDRAHRDFAPPGLRHSGWLVAHANRAIERTTPAARRVTDSAGV